VTDYVLDADKSRVRIHTYAEGLLARLAHDLELRCAAPGLSGSGTRDGETAKATIEARVGAIEVAGVLKGERVDEHGLSPGERHDVLAKMKKEVFHAGDAADARVVVEATLEKGSARLKVTTPNGRTFEATTKAALTEEGAGVRASGAFELSLSRIGSDVVKGPMGAFRMKDKVQVLFDLLLQPA
jgi:FtsP/CotA-like multicopper oxidase with cupredoxin domain